MKKAARIANARLNAGEYKSDVSLAGVLHEAVYTDSHGTKVIISRWSMLTQIGAPVSTPERVLVVPVNECPYRPRQSGVYAL